MCKPRGKGRRRLVCHHEAGHALARWYFGHLTDRVTVLTAEQVRAGETIEDERGRRVPCEGLCEGYDIIGYPFGPTRIEGGPEKQARINHALAVSRDVELIHCVAGFYAEADYGRLSPSACMFSGGLKDMARLKIVLDAWDLHDDEGHASAALAGKRATALVRSPKGAAAIGALADALMERGEVECEEIGTIFRGAYDGRECRFGAWNAHWPPTLDQLRAGFIPERAEVSSPIGVRWASVP